MGCVERLDDERVVDACDRTSKCLGEALRGSENIEADDLIPHGHEWFSKTSLEILVKMW